ncbi:MAG TPA: NAD(P)-binding domain-containing protein [Blastocatellia bacterium]|nr:NAD(P)-binding domain-containing protein [Blastocatellia bacterium]
MKRSQLVITLFLLAGVLVAAFVSRFTVSFGAVPPMGWLGLILFAGVVGLALVATDTFFERKRVIEAMAEAEMQPSDTKAKTVVVPQSLGAALDPDGPPYPHPVINTATCIGCHACVDACPHDVLAIVNGKATPIAIEQCTEDTSCQVECPTVPKSCIVINTTKQIPERKVPKRDQQFLTNVPGVYLIGDVSGVPLIKNAINEGGAVVDCIVEDLKHAGKNGDCDYDVAIVGIGPAGLSATALAKQRGLKYIAIEQDQVVGTIQQTYQAGKYVYFNPVEKPVNGGINLSGAGATKEVMIGSWMETIRTNGLTINEYESCKSVKPVGDSFIVETDQDKTKRKMQYSVRRVILAIGNRGTPMKLGVPGEDSKIVVTATEMIMPAFCNKCGEKRLSDNRFCHNCGQKYIPKVKQTPAFEDDKVKYKLTDPNDYSGKHIVVVGAGNSAIEAAVDLAAYRSDDGTQITGWRDNTVSLIIRSNLKSDLKLGNKMLVYDCIDEGKITAYFGQTIKEVTPTEVALMSARERDPKTAEETARLQNDYIFALIGGEKPTKFLESIGIKIG